MSFFYESSCALSSETGRYNFKMTEKAGSPLARTVLQQCLYARLQVKPADDQSEAEWVEVLLNYFLLLS